MEIALRREDFTTSYPPYSVLNTKQTELLWQKKPINVYVHFPFCPKRCDFCYYKVEVPKGKDEIQAYVDVLLKEIELLSCMPELHSCSMQTLYFGGGTPTLLSSDQLVAVTEAIFKLFPKMEDFEFCVEVRPGGEVTKEKLKTLKSLGVDRISMGVQSLDDDILLKNGRNHLSNQFYKTFEETRNAGFDWINCDIMSGMLGITDESWQNTVKTLADWRPENVAIYKMEVYYNTKLFKKVRHEPELLIDDAMEASHFEWARAYLESEGYMMWDCFSFTTNEKYIHRHRRNVQSGGEILGIGLSSHSYFNGFMYQNTSDMGEYVQMVESGEIPVTRAYKLSAQDEIVRYIVFGLKNLSFDRKDFIQRFGADVSVLFPEQIETCLRENFITMDEDKVMLTPRYYGYADDIARLFYPERRKDAMLAHISRRG